MRNGKIDLAIESYEAVLKNASSEEIRGLAISGKIDLLLTQSKVKKESLKKAESLLISLLNSKNIQNQKIGLRRVTAFPDLSFLAEPFLKFDSSIKLGICSQLRLPDRSQFLPLLLSQLNVETEKELQTSMLQAIGRIGDQTAVAPLAKIAKNIPELMTSCDQALESLPDLKANDLMSAYWKKGDKEIGKRMLKISALRGDRSSIPELFKIGADNEHFLQKEAIVALGELTLNENLEEFLKMGALLKNEAVFDTYKIAILNLTKRLKDKEKVLGLLRQSNESKNNEKMGAIYIFNIAQLKTAEANKAILELCKTGSDISKFEAIKAFAADPDLTKKKELKDLAKNSDSVKGKLAAFQAYLQVLSLNISSPLADQLRDYQEAILMTDSLEIQKTTIDQIYLLHPDPATLSFKGMTLTEELKSYLSKKNKNETKAILLSADDAVIVEESAKKNTGLVYLNWIKEGGIVQWNKLMIPNNTYRVFAWTAIGGRLRLKIGKASVEAEMEETTGLEDFQKNDMGVIQVEGESANQVVLEFVEAGVNVLKLQLIPVTPH